MRVENERYKSGVKRLQNLKIAPQGGASSREGFVFVAEGRYRNKAVRIIPFEFSTDQAYIIEMGNLYMRFYRNNDIITESGKAITGITKANPGVVTAVAHGFSNGDEVFLLNVGGMTQVNGKRYLVANVAADTFELTDINGTNVNTTSYTTYTSGGTANRIYQITTTYTEAQLFDVSYTQSADVLFMVHPVVPVKKVSRTAHTAWSINSVTFVDGPYLAQNTTTTTLDPSASAVGTGVTLVASATTGINSDTGFQTTDVGRFVRLKHSSTWGYGIITARASTTSVTISILTAFGADTATSEWRLGSWSDTTGYPECCAFYQQRLFFGATSTQPDTVWGSGVDDFTDFAPGTADADSVEYTLASQKVNRIRWLSPQKTLRIGTSGGEFELSGSDTNASISPTNVKVSRISSHGSSTVDPVLIDTATLFWQRANRKLREFIYSYDIDALVAVDLTVISEHISEGGIKEMAYQAEPNGIIWAAKTNGKLIGMTYLRTEKVVGWHQHVIGGPAGTKVESVACIPIDGQDQLWAVVKRTINGSVRRYVERLGNDFFNNSTNTVKDAQFLDSSLMYSGATPSATLTPSATTGTAVTFTAGSSVFASTDVGRHIRTSYTDADGTVTNSKAIITAYTSGTVVTASIAKAFVNTSAIASGSWTLSVSSLSGLDQWEGETLSILADGGTHADATVSSGAISLGGQYTKVVTGYGYTQVIESLDFEGSSVLGSVQGTRSRITDFIIRLYKTVGFSFGFSLDKLERVDFRRPSDEMDEGVPLYTGDKIKRPPAGYKDELKMFIVQDQPLPLNVLGFVAKSQSSDAP